VFRTSLKNIPSRVDFLIFFLYISFVFIASVFGFRGIWSIIPLRETLSNGRSHNSLSSLDFFSFIYHNTTWLDPGRVFGCIYNWQGLDTGGLFYLALFLPLSLALKKKTYTQQCTTLGPSPRQKLLYGIFADILGTFFSLLFPFFSFVRFRETSWKIPPKQGRPIPEFNNSNRHTLLLSLALFPDLRRYYFNDDLFYDSMTNDDYFSDMMRLTNGITNNRLDVET